MPCSDNRAPGLPFARAKKPRDTLANMRPLAIEQQPGKQRLQGADEPNIAWRAVMNGLARH